MKTEGRLRMKTLLITAYKVARDPRNARWYVWGLFQR